MSLKEEIEDKFDRYLLGSMDEQEREIFEVELKINPVLKDEFAQHELASEAIRILGTHQAKSKVLPNRKVVSAREGNWGTIENKELKVGWHKYAIILTIVIIVGVSVIMNIAAPIKLSNEELYNKFTITERYVLAPDASLLTKDAALYFNMGNYAVAEFVFVKLMDLEPENYTNLFYLAYCALQNNEIDLARSRLEKIIQADYSNKAKAQWYLALTYLIQNNGERSKEILIQLASNKKEKYYSGNALKLLAEMK